MAKEIFKNYFNIIDILYNTKRRKLQKSKLQPRIEDSIKELSALNELSVLFKIDKIANFINSYTIVKKSLREHH